MKLLFCYDGPLKKDENGNYYGSALNNTVLEKYKQIANEITLAIRVKKILESDAKKKLTQLLDDYKVIEVPNVNSIKGILIENKKINRIIEDAVNDSDYIIARIPSRIGEIAMKYAKKYNKKCLVEMVGCPWDSYWNYSLKGKLVAPIRFIQTRNVVKNASHVMYVSNNFLQTRYPTDGMSIGCSDVNLVSLEDEVLNNRLKKNCKSEKKVLGTLAAINVKYKGQEYVIKAIPKLLEKGYDVEYQLVGGGSNERLLKIAKKYKVEDRVKFVGSLPHGKVFDWLDSIDVYVQPSNQEGLCRALVEAMSRGCPCVASSAGGNPELIDKEFIFSRKNVKELINKLDSLLSKDMVEQAKVNFNKAKNFENTLLNERRKDFYKNFLGE